MRAVGGRVSPPLRFLRCTIPPALGRGHPRALSARTGPAEQPPLAAPRPRQRTPTRGQVSAAAAGTGDQPARGADKGTPHDTCSASGPQRPGRGGEALPASILARRSPRAPRGRSQWVTGCSRARRALGRDGEHTPGTSPAPRYPERDGCSLDPGPRSPGSLPKPPARTHRPGAPSPARSAGGRGCSSGGSRGHSPGTWAPAGLGPPGWPLLRRTPPSRVPGRGVRCSPLGTRGGFPGPPDPQRRRARQGAGGEGRTAGGRAGSGQ